jgi:hypothetical protein
VDKNWYFKNWTLNLYFDVENATAAALNTQALILDRGPMESGIIVNPDAPIELQRYKVKTIDDTQGTLVPSIGIRIDI